MAYLTKENAAEKRAALKKAFPTKDGWKIFVRNEHYSTLQVTVMQYPKDYDFPGYAQLNAYVPVNMDREELSSNGQPLGRKEAEAVNKMIEIMDEGYWDESDIMTDYFHSAYYKSLHIGRWDKEAVKAAK
jgi:hypothetical protein